MLGVGLWSADSSTVSVKIEPLTQTILPSQTFEIAIIFSMQSGWHTYWQNPGEAGIPTRFEWKLPQGFSVIAQNEPVPTRHREDGITTFIHEDEAIYVFLVSAPDVIPDTSAFAVSIEWLECREICRAGASQLSFHLPQETGNPNHFADILKRAEAKFADEASLESELCIKGNKVILHQTGNPGEGLKLIGVDFFPSAEMVYDIASPVRIKNGLFKSSISIPLSDFRAKNPERLKGVLIRTYSSPKGVITKQTIVNEPIKHRRLLCF